MPQKTAADAPGIRPQLHSVREARRLCGDIGNTKAYELISEGQWQAVKLGGRTFVTADSLNAFIESLPRAHIGTGQNRNVA